MNPIDHPHGGGEGRTSGGRHPSTPWGMPTKGYKTRKQASRPTRSSCAGARPRSNGIADGGSSVRDNRTDRLTEEGKAMSSFDQEGAVRRRASLLAKKVDALNANSEKRVIKTWSRRSTVDPRVPGPHHRGAQRSSSSCPCMSQENMIGHKLGEFAPTRTYRGHTSKKK